MKLVTIKRAAKTKSEVNALRRSGYIPAVLYVKGKAGETLAIQSVEFGAFLRNVQPGHLPTSIFTLVDDKGNERRAIVKDIQYNIINYSVTHLDFEELVEGHPINVKVPIECVGMIDCVGIKLGGVLRQVIRHARINCLPKDIPTSFELDVRDLGMRQAKRLSDLKFPETVKPVGNLNEVVAAIVKR